MWAKTPFAQTLAKEYGIITPDLRGHGRRAKPRPEAVPQLDPWSPGQHSCASSFQTLQKDWQVSLPIFGLMS
jgi:hypothetical protein